MRLAIILTHPIQYYTPVFQQLQKQGNITIKVFYTNGENSKKQFDPGFGRYIHWDIPLLAGYSYEILENTSRKKAENNFCSIITPALIDKIRLYAPDGILVYGWSYHSHLQAIRYFYKKIPIYFRGDSTLLDERGIAKRLFRYLALTWVYRHVDHAFYVGEYNKAYFRKYGLRDAQLTFSPHAIDNDRFIAGDNMGAILLRKQLGLKEDEILILFAGKFEKKKDPQILLDAFMLIDRSDVHLLFVGNGNLEPVLKNGAIGKTNIHFMDFQNQKNMPIVYKACDLFCLPSRGPAETWGLAVNEAMACKKAILVSDKVGCSIDLVKPGYNGFIFKAGDIADLISQLEILIKSNQRKLAEMGEYSFNIIQDWSIQNQIDAIEKILNEK
jgi:glycosyltransferase involved in cell wall biosynthesis